MGLFLLTLLSLAIDSRVQAALKAWDVPGVAVVVVTPEHTLYLKGHGRRDAAGRPVTPDTVFPLASCTKAFTTALIARLADEGKISWDDPVRKHVPDFRLSDPAADALVVLRDLAAHRTGVGSHDLMWYRSPWSQAEMVRRVGRLPLAKPFRTEMQYQTVMYIAAGQAAAAAGGKPWAELVREKILDPLGMTDFCLTSTEAARRPDRAGGFREIGGAVKAVDEYPQPEPNCAVSAHASARELIPWLRFQLTGGRHGEDQLVSEAALRETQAPHTPILLDAGGRAVNPDAHLVAYALAWVAQDYRGHLLVQHTGLIDGYRAHLTLLPNDGYAFAILANRQGTRLNLALSNTLVDLLVGLPGRDWNAIQRQALDEARAVAQVQARREDLARRPDLPPSVGLEQLAGEYEDAAYGKGKVVAGADGLTWEWGTWKLPLEHYARDTFRFRTDDDRLDRMMVRFRVEDGTVKGVHLFGVPFARTGK
ncbi:MAG TPA: serine hydrolase [Gemmataceae bacterium]|nr:serine hydrolase [Gemmataceae bacterium]